MRPPEFVQRDRDDLTYPIRLRFRVPPHDPGPELDRLRTWLRAELAGRAACHLVNLGAEPVVLVHLLQVEDVARVRDAFPALELAVGPLRPA